MYNNKLHANAKNLLFCLPYDEFSETLTDYKEFLTNNEYHNPLLKEKYKMNTMIKFLVMVLILLVMVISYGLVQYSIPMNYHIQLLSIGIMGIVLPLVVFKCLQRKVMVLSKFHTISKLDRNLAALTTILSFLIVVLYYYIDMYLANHTMFYYRELNELILIIILMAVTIYGFYNYTQKSCIFFSTFLSNYIASLLICQIKIIHSMLTPSMGEYRLYFMYVYVMCFISVSLLVVYNKNTKGKLQVE